MEISSDNPVRPEPSRQLAPLPLSIGSCPPQPRPSGLSFRWCGNIDPLSIAYASLPRLRSRLTLGRIAWPRKPWVYGGQGFHLPSRYLCLHALLSALHLQSPSGFHALTMLSYHTDPANRFRIQSFSMPLDRQSFSARDHSMSQLLRTV